MYDMGHKTWLLCAEVALLLQLAAGLQLGRSQPTNSRIKHVDGSKAAAHQCTDERWFLQPRDHFSHTPSTDAKSWRQRVYICDKYWKPGGPIFFYAGGEADIWVYMNATGMMWENAERFDATLIFAEHRYYGVSGPFGSDSWKVDPSFLTTEQALADFAALLYAIKTGQEGAHNSPVIVFGGSYGGMLAVWMRAKYPHLVAGAIAASAPLKAWPGIEGFDPAAFWKVVTYNAGPAGGCDERCANLTRLAFNTLLTAGKSAEARTAMSRLLRLCRPLNNEQDVLAAAYWVQGAFDAFAMGNYPYPSSYMSGDPEHPLPAWPMQAACMKLTKTMHHYQSELIEALGQAAGVMYNASGKLTCFDLQTQGPAAGNEGPWDFQVCTEQLAQEQPYFPANGVTDMFWDQGSYDSEAIDQHCMETWGVKPTPDWALIEYGGPDILKSTSNIVLSNGLLDPWSAYGVLEDVSETVVSVIIPEGAHHVDLMFNHPADTPAIKQARHVELQWIERWIKEYKKTHAGAKPSRVAKKQTMNEMALQARHPLLAGKRLLVPFGASQTNDA